MLHWNFSPALPVPISSHILPLKTNTAWKRNLTTRGSIRANPGACLQDGKLFWIRRIIAGFLCLHTDISNFSIQKMSSLCPHPAACLQDGKVFSIQRIAVGTFCLQKDTPSGSIQKMVKSTSNMKKELVGPCGQWKKQADHKWLKSSHLRAVPQDGNAGMIRSTAVGTSCPQMR